MLGRLTPVGGGIPVILLKKTVTLGRDPANDHAIACGSVSGKHCELELIDGYWWVRDLGSRNGTAVNNVRCQTSKILPGGVLRMASQRFRLDYKEPRVSADEEVAMSLLMEGISTIPAPQVVSEKPSGSDSLAAQRQAIRQRSDSSHASTPVITQTKSVRRFLGKLVPCGGGDPIPLLESPLLVGRRSACDITLKFPDVSSRHCTLTYEEGFWVVDDCGSRNGVRVNGERVERKVLYPEDRISFASHRFTVHYTPEGTLPPAEDDTFSKSLLEKIGMKDLSRLEQKRILGAVSEDDQPKRMTLE
ncbi:MAG: FHA domain-containing protein [Planctomycetaceae bacterium]